MSRSVSRGPQSDLLLNPPRGEQPGIEAYLPRETESQQEERSWGTGVFPTSRALVQTPPPSSGPYSPRAHFVRLAPRPHPRGVGCADGEAVTRVRLQLHQLDGGAQDFIEDPGAVFCLGHLTVVFPDHFL